MKGFGLLRLLFAEWRELEEVKNLLHHIKHKLEDIMSAISDFAAKQAAHNDKIDKAIDGLTADIQALKDLIATLQNSPDEISAEDQATLDALETKAGQTADKLAALDDLTPPTPPTP
jgi:uncharacterized protein YaaN involved in tellurite resistance